MMFYNKYDKSTVLIRIQRFFPEKFINILWNNGITVKNTTKKNIITVIMEVYSSDMERILELGNKYDTKISILGTRGSMKYILKLKKRWSLLIGFILFLAAIFYLSSFIWFINIETDKYLSPYEIRSMIKNHGVKPGILKNSINLSSLEKQMVKESNDILWLKARMEGAVLKISVVERQQPPNIQKDDSPCDVVAKMDGEVVMIYSTAGTAEVKEGSVVKKDSVLIRGQQGKEGNSYPVHGDGQVIAKTVYQCSEEYEIETVRKTTTGKRIENLFFNIGNKKIYIKKSLNTFNSYDKILDSDKFIQKEIYYETNIVKDVKDKNKLKDDAIKSMKNKIFEDLGREAKLLNTNVETELLDNRLKVTVVFEVLQNIGIQKKS